MFRKYSLLNQLRHVTRNQRCLFKHNTASRQLDARAVIPVAPTWRHTTSVQFHCRPCLQADHTPPSQDIISELSDVEYESVSEATLESLTERFDDLAESDLGTDEFDVSYSSGVLTVKLGSQYGTYVINKQSPNKQIWLSSPLSGPKRYDFIEGQWIYKHDNKVLHNVLTEELSIMFKEKVDFTQCSHAQRGS